MSLQKEAELLASIRIRTSAQIANKHALKAKVRLKLNRAEFTHLKALSVEALARQTVKQVVNMGRLQS